jgi:hypothetical protein
VATDVLGEIFVDGDSDTGAVETVEMPPATICSSPSVNCRSVSFLSVSLRV